MVKDAEQNSTEDKKRREEIDTRNRLDSLAYEVEKNSKEWSDRLAPEMKARLEASVERARKAHRGDDMGEVKSASKNSTTPTEAGRSLYARRPLARDGAQAGAEEPRRPARPRTWSRPLRDRHDKSSGSCGVGRERHSLPPFCPPLRLVLPIAPSHARRATRAYYISDIFPVA
jgi:hypothetical protein